MSTSRTGFAADAGASAHVLVPALDDGLAIDGPEAHHLVRVRRLRVGERITAADGAGTWRAYVVESVGAATLALRAEGAPTVEPRPGRSLALAFAPPKGDRPERIVRHATELGVDRIHLLMTERTVARPGAGREPKARERLERVVRAAAAQSFRSRLPEVGATLTVEALARLPGLVVADRSGGQALGLLDPGAGWVAAVGPEGGFAPAESALLAGAPKLALGAWILRSETAALAACTVLATLRDDLGRRSEYDA